MKLAQRLALLLVCVRAVWAEPVGLLWLDAQGYWDPTQRSGIAVKGAISDPDLLLRRDSVRRLSFQQRLDLLHDPERLLQSQRALELFSTPRLLLMEPEKDDHVLATYFDLEHHRRLRMVADPELSPSEGREQLVKRAQGEYGPDSVAVVANLQSHRYHLREAKHISPDAPLRELASSYQAQEQGFLHCDICFERSEKSPDQDDVERELGRLLARQVEGQFRLSQDAAAIERVNRVGKRLVTANQIEHDYQFVVLDSDLINAFAVPTGPVYVTTGLLAVVETEDELSGVMGHELAHSELHHGLRQYEQAQQWSWLSLLAGIATRNAWIYNAAQVFGTVLNRGYSREFELEADRQGTWYSYGAGYHADHFKLTLQKFLDLEQRRGSGGFYWLRTHPGSEDRMNEINDILSRLEPLQLLLEEIEPDDPGLARYLKRRGEKFLEHPREVVSFYTAYRSLVGTGSP